MSVTWNFHLRLGILAIGSSFNLPYGEGLSGQLAVDGVSERSNFTPCFFRARYANANYFKSRRVRLHSIMIVNQRAECAKTGSDNRRHCISSRGRWVLSLIVCDCKRLTVVTESPPRLFRQKQPVAVLSRSASRLVQTGWLDPT